MSSYTLKQAATGAWSKASSAKMRAAVDAGLLSAGYKIVQDIQANIIPIAAPRGGAIVDRAIYKNSWRVKKKSSGAVDVYSVAPQAPMIERGVRPENVKIGRKMIAALAAWARRKGIGSKSSVKTKKVVKMTAAAAEGIAWAIAKTMKKVGIFNTGGLIPGKKGIRVLEFAVKRAKAAGTIQAEIKAEIERAMRGGKP